MCTLTQYTYGRELQNVILQGTLSKDAEPFLDESREVSCRLTVRTQHLHVVSNADISAQALYTVEITEKSLHRLLFHYARKGSAVFIPGLLMPCGKKIRAHLVYPA